MTPIRTFVQAGTLTSRLRFVDRKPVTTPHTLAPRTMLNKVPEVTMFFWLIKVLCTTVGETFADNLNEKLKLGLTNTT